MIKLPRRINDFTKPELDYFREQCNFSEKEMQYFNLKAQDKSIVQIAMEMNIAEPTVSKLAKKVKAKMIRVI